MNSLTVLLPAVMLSACSHAHQPTEPSSPTPAAIGPVVAKGSTVVPSVPPPSPLEICLLDGGRLVELSRVDNNDVADHGDLVAFAVSEDRQLAAAGADGTVKLWTIDGFVATAGFGEILYGVEATGTQAADLAWRGDQIVAGDVRGVVSGWSPELGFRVLGGTEPDVAITAIAFDATGARLAHADEHIGGAVMVRDLVEGETHGPLETDIERVHDLTFSPTGELIVAGIAGASPALEIRAADAPIGRLHRFVLHSGPAGFVEVAVSGDGTTIAAVDVENVHLFDRSLSSVARFGVHGHRPHTVAVTPTGSAIVSAGADGKIRVFDASSAESVAEIDAPDPVSVRLDPAGELIFGASRDGTLRAIGCSR